MYISISAVVLKGFPWSGGCGFMRVPSSCLSVHVYLGYRWKWVHNTSCFLFGDILGRPAEPRANPATLPWCTCHWTARLNAEGIIRKNLLHGSGPHTGVHGSSWGLVFSGFFSLNLSRTPSGACIDNIMHLWGGVLAAQPPPPPRQGEASVRPSGCMLSSWPCLALQGFLVYDLPEKWFLCWS